MDAVYRSLALDPKMIPAEVSGAVDRPALAALNIMHLHSPQSAILSAVIFNALVIVTLIPLALKGVKYRAVGAGKLLSQTCWSTASAACSPRSSASS